MEVVAQEQVVSQSAPRLQDDAPRTLTHYLYVPTREGADEIAEELKGRGYQIEQRASADGVNWLVLARHEAVPSEELLYSTSDVMGSLLNKVGGEYDGWEAEISDNPVR